MIFLIEVHSLLAALNLIFVSYFFFTGVSSYSIHIIYNNNDYSNDHHYNKNLDQENLLTPTGHTMSSVSPTKSKTYNNSTSMSSVKFQNFTTTKIATTVNTIISHSNDKITTSHDNVTTSYTNIKSITVPVKNDDDDDDGHLRIRRNASSFEDDEIGWTNINEEVDMALKTIWPYFIEQGYTTLALPDLTDRISIRPLLITYSADLKLTNGHLYDIQEIQRSGDAYMTYYDKSFQFRLNLILRSQQFVYDFLVGVFGLGLSGTVDGHLENTLVSGDFSIRVKDANVKLNDFRILSYGNMDVSLQHHSIIRQLSSLILNPITNFFRDRLTTTISDAIRLQLENLMNDINKNDTLQLKKFLNNTLSGLIAS